MIVSVFETLSEVKTKFRVQLVDCEIMQFFQQSRFSDFLSGWQRFMDFVFGSCGKG